MARMEGRPEPAFEARAVADERRSGEEGEPVRVGVNEVIGGEREGVRGV